MTEKKSNKTMILALLVLVLIITGTFIATYAKYVTANTVDESAVVAKFGLNIPGTIDLFADSYTNVQSDTEDKKIIAPGTTGKYTFIVTGTSEVAYTVSADITVTYSEEWADYEPLQFSTDGDAWTTFEEFETKLRDALASDTLEPNKPYSGTQTIHWQWPYYVSPENDVKDTAMGALAADGTAPEVTIGLKVTATQVD